MATITTDTFLDGGVARTAGETWTINGGSLIIRTDTRWHANAPASMTGSLGSVVCNSVGGFQVNGQNVRWMAFDSGSGTVPAIGTTITQGGVSGYLLGVWATIDAAPTAVGAAMPAVGFIKFREVTGGQFVVGSALSGISATPLATPGSGAGADAPGWIEVVKDQGTSGVVTGYKSAGTIVTGQWFYLGETNGSRGQTFLTPINGGGSGSYCLGVQIETSPGSGIYEWWPGVETSMWLTTQVASDLRAKVVESAASGVIRIGADASANSIGHLPPAGCKVRIPGVIMRQCTTAARASNNITTTTGNRPSISSTGNVTASKMSCDWYAFPTSPNAPKKGVTFVDSIFEGSPRVIGVDNVSITSCATVQLVVMSGVPFQLVSCKNSTVNSMKVVARGSTQNTTFNQCDGATVTNLTCANAHTGVVGQLAIQNTNNSSFTNVKTHGGGITFATCSNVIVDGHDIIYRFAGDTTAAGSVHAVAFSGCTNVTHSGLTFGEGGALSNCQPYAGVYVISGRNPGPVKLRNAGSLASPLATGASATLYPAAVVSVSSSDTDSEIRIQRVFIENTRSGFFNPSQSGVNSVKYLFESSKGSYSGALTGGNTLPIDTIVRGVGCTVSSNYIGDGNVWADVFTSTTTGAVVVQAASPSALSSTYTELSVNTSVAVAGFDSGVGVNLPTVGDYVIFETPYWIKGHTGFQNNTPSIVGSSTANLTLQYQLDTGSGFGTLKTLNGTNLSAETISPSGFKMRVKITANASNSGTAFQRINILTTTTTTAQTNNPYELDSLTLSFTGLQPGSEVRCYTGSNPATAVEIGGVESTAGSTFSFTHSSAGITGFIRIFALGYQPISIDPYTYPSSDTSLLIQQTVDRNYVNP